MAINYKRTMEDVRAVLSSHKQIFPAWYKTSNLKDCEERCYFSTKERWPFKQCRSFADKLMNITERPKGSEDLPDQLFICEECYNELFNLERKVNYNLYQQSAIKELRKQWENCNFDYRTDNSYEKKRCEICDFQTHNQVIVNHQQYTVCRYCMSKAFTTHCSKCGSIMKPSYYDYDVEHILCDHCLELHSIRAEEKEKQEREEVRRQARLANWDGIYRPDVHSWQMNSWDPRYRES